MANQPIKDFLFIIDESHRSIPQARAMYNGDYSRKLELPSSEYKRIYRVCIKGKIELNKLKLINKGIKIKESISSI